MLTHCCFLVTVFC